MLFSKDSATSPLRITGCIKTCTLSGKSTAMFKSGKYLSGIEVIMSVQYYCTLTYKNIFSFLLVSPDVIGRK